MSTTSPSAIRPSSAGTSPVTGSGRWPKRRSLWWPRRCSLVASASSPLVATAPVSARGGPPRGPTSTPTPVLRGVRAADAGKLEPRPSPLPLPVPRRVRPGEPHPAPTHGLRAGVGRHPRPRPLAGAGVRPSGEHLTPDQARGVIAGVHDAVALFADANPAEKATLYAELGLRLTYHPGSGGGSR